MVERYNRKIASKANNADRTSLPKWFPVVGATFLGLELAYFMVVSFVSLTIKITPDTKQLLIIVLAIGAAASVFFLGGSVSATGELPIPLVRKRPVAFAVSGGIASLIIVWILGYWMWIPG